MLSGDKAIRYLTYAIGEIFLVVIGIIIAIQLNEWNQHRIDKKQETLMLENLQNEFERTREFLSYTLSDYIVTIDANIALMGLFSSDGNNMTELQIDTMLAKSFKQAPFYPTQPVLSELLNSGEIKSLENENLKHSLLDWEAMIRWFHFDYDLMLKFSNDELFPYLNKNWSWKNIDIAEGTKFYTERSVLATGQKELFRELEFENLIDSNLFHSNRLYQRLEKIQLLIDRILSEIGSSLQDT